MNRVLGFLVGANFLAIAGFVVGVAGLVSSIYFYAESQASRDPVIRVEPIRYQVAYTGVLERSSLRVVRANGEQINENVQILTFYFWNKGKLAIRKEHVLRPIVFRFTDPSVEILDYKVLSQSRKVVGATLMPSEGATKNSLDLRFDILEHLDGFTAQLIYAGPFQAGFSVDGSIEGVRSLTAEEKWAEVRFPLSAYHLTPLAGSLLLFLAVTFYPARFRMLRDLLARRHDEIRASPEMKAPLNAVIATSYYLLSVILTVGVFCAIVAIGYLATVGAAHMSRSTLMDTSSVPEWIRPKTDVE